MMIMVGRKVIAGVFVTMKSTAVIDREKRQKIKMIPELNGNTTHYHKP